MMEICEVCQSGYEPEEIHGVRQLKTFTGYTVDFRLKQFRKMSVHALPDYIDFASPEGQTLVAAMHEMTIMHAYEKGNTSRREQKK